VKFAKSVLEWLIVNNQPCHATISSTAHLKLTRSCTPAAPVEVHTDRYDKELVTYSFMLPKSSSQKNGGNPDQNSDLR